MTKPKVSILLPAYKSKELLEKVFVKSLHNIREDFELIIYDNGGNGLSGCCEQCDAEVLGDFSFDHKIKIIGNGVNVGLNRALNKCFEKSSGKYIFLPHTDQYILPGCLEALVAEAKKHAPHTFLFCSRSIEPGFSHIKSQIRADYGNEWNNFREKDLMKDHKKYIENGIVINARMPFFMHRKLWEKIGGLDDAYHSFCTDDDVIQQCYDVGVRKFWMIYSSLLYHLQGKSNNQQTVDKDRNEPYEYFVKKWKNKYPDICHPGQYHPRLIPFETRIK